jgi:mannose-6-phosphate isomerase-like protein (cupin superfamily)
MKIVIEFLEEIVKMKINLDGGDGVMVKSNETYDVIDNTNLDNLVVSKTTLHPKKSTTGHNHKGQEEVYQFVAGYGTMIVGTDSYFVGSGDIVLIPDGDFHRVTNTSDLEDLIFICVFDGRRSH